MLEHLRRYSLRVLFACHISRFGHKRNHEELQSFSDGDWRLLGDLAHLFVGLHDALDSRSGELGLDWRRLDGRRRHLARLCCRSLGHHAGWGMAVCVRVPYLSRT
jgi:hypothetical protein